ncbi:MAG: sulfotransferase [Pseudomonadota bacterium]
MSKRTPIVMFGALRSGTTLFRLILDHHPDLSIPGESDFLLDHIAPDDSHPSGWRYDKAALRKSRTFVAHGLSAPDDLDGTDLLAALIDALAVPPARSVLVFHRNAEKLAQLLPAAPVIHLLRDPRDVARSSIDMGWAGNSYYGVTHWIETERSWQASGLARGLADGQALTVHFEALMQEMQAELTRVCAFLGLAFAPEMLSYPETTTYGPPDPGIAQKWRARATPREVARIEARIEAHVPGLLAASGYAPSESLREMGALEHRWVMADHRVRRWRFTIRRYGFWLFAGHLVSRLSGSRALRQRVEQRREEIALHHLK